MKAYLKFLSVVLILVFTLTGVSLFGAGAQSTYVQPEKFIYGDVNLDGDVTVKDATLIQKGLAKITYVTAVQRYLADPDGTGYSVKNATAIQKHLAKYETETPWGTELEMSNQNEFSKVITQDSSFVDDSIVIAVDYKSDYIYTVEDFPEYKFKSIEIIGKHSTHNINFYILQLEYSGKNNVIEAIKSLDYRFNIDLAAAGPNYIYDLA